MTLKRIQFRAVTSSFVFLVSFSWAALAMAAAQVVVPTEGPSLLSKSALSLILLGIAVLGEVGKWVDPANVETTWAWSPAKRVAIFAVLSAVVGILNQWTSGGSSLESLMAALLTFLPALLAHFAPSLTSAAAANRAKTFLLVSDQKKGQGGFTTLGAVVISASVLVVGLAGASAAGCVRAGETPVQVAQTVLSDADQACIDAELFLAAVDQQATPDAAYLRAACNLVNATDQGIAAGVAAWNAQPAAARATKLGLKKKT